MRRVVAVLGISTLAFVGAAPTHADPPGPGDKQCTPGRQGNPHPGHKAGACKKK